MYDQFNDLPVWVNRDTQEILFDKPTNTLSYPKMPYSLIDENGKPLTPRKIARLEASSSSDDDDDEFASSSSSSSHSSNYINSVRHQKDPKVNNNILASTICELRGKDAELEFAQQRVLEKRRSRILEVAAKGKKSVSSTDK